MEAMPKLGFDSSGGFPFSSALLQHFEIKPIFKDGSKDGRCENY
jgi:hypothetical protein